MSGIQRFRGGAMPQHIQAASLQRSLAILLSAECQQFYIQDEYAERNLDWDEESSRDRLALAPGTINVGTISDGVLPVELEISPSPPSLDLDLWDRVIECGISLPSGRVILGGCFDEPEKSARLHVCPGH